MSSTQRDSIINQFEHSLSLFCRLVLRKQQQTSASSSTLLLEMLAIVYNGIIVAFLQWNSREETLHMLKCI